MREWDRGYRLNHPREVREILDAGAAFVKTHIRDSPVSEIRSSYTFNLVQESIFRHRVFAGQDR